MPTLSFWDAGPGQARFLNPEQEPGCPGSWGREEKTSPCDVKGVQQTQ